MELRRKFQLNNNFEYILFDLDGTITDSGEGITKAVQYSLKHFDILVENLDDLRKFIGPPLRDSYIKFYDFDNVKAELGIVKFREYYEDKGIFENKLYEGIVTVLEELNKNKKTIILATSKPEVYAKQILKHFNIDKYFSVIAGADFEETRVNKSDVIKYAINQLNIEDLSKVVMIGDREHDIIGAKENNLKSIGVLYGFGDVVELTQCRADYIVKTPQDILNIILK